MEKKCSMTAFHNFDKYLFLKLIITLKNNYKP
jgi:hypothetical protein